MKVKMLRDARVLVSAGSELEIADEGARYLVSLGSAVEMKSKQETPEKAVSEASETKASKSKRK